VYPNVYVYMESYSTLNNIGQKFSMEEFDEEGRLRSKLMADYIQWNEKIGKWTINRYYVRRIQPDREFIETGRKLDTTLTITPENFNRRKNYVETMNLGELHDYIDLLILQGSDELRMYQVEKHRRFANPFSVFILTLIGVTLASRKVRGGIGMQIGIGILLSFSYILIMQFSSQFAMKAGLDPMLAMWIPNIVYLGVAFFLYRMAPK
jgi:lipopolysaccharide export system permease protein